MADSSNRASPNSKSVNPGAHASDGGSSLQYARDSDAARRHFRTISQANVDWLQNPLYGFAPWQESGRVRTKNGAEGFVHMTLNTPHAVPHMLFLVNKQIQIPPIQESLGRESDGSESRSGGSRAQTTKHTADIVILVQLQSPGADGWIGVTHAGISCALLDCAMGNVIVAHLYKLIEEGTNVGGDGIFTAYLNTQFLAPVRSGGRTVVVKGSALARTRRSG